MKRGLIFILSAFFIRTGVSSQTDVSGCIRSLTSLWDEFQPTRFDGLIVDSAYTLTSDPFTIQANPSAVQRQQLLLRSNEALQRINSKNLGLHATFSYQENLNTPLFDPDEFIIFKRRAIAGVDWDLLNNGLYENKLRNKVLKLEQEALKREALKEELSTFVSEHAEQVMRYFNDKKLKVLDTRKRLNARQLEIIEKLWAGRHLSKDDYLKAIQNTTDIRAQYHVYEGYNHAPLTGKKDLATELPLLDIDIDELFSRAKVPMADSADPLNRERYAAYQSNYLREVSLKAYTRYNYYYLINTAQSSRSFVSVGMNLSMPISFNQRDKREYAALQQQIAGYQTERSEPALQALLLNYYYEYAYKLKLFKNLYHKHLVYGELLRTERVKAELNDVEFNPNTALFILDDCWGNVIELLNLKQELYRILLSIKQKLPAVPITDYTKILTLDNLEISASKPPYKAVYAWSDVFRNHDPAFVAEYCAFNEFNPVLLSYNPSKAQQASIKAFMDKGRGINILLMIGSNKLLQTGIGGYLDSLNAGVDLSRVKGLHLDIEPHTVDGFKDNKDALLKQYLGLVKEARSFASRHGMGLSVSIPLHYPEWVLQALDASCDEVYLMAFENTDYDFILKKTVEEKSILKDKCVLALRAKDFKDRNDMELFFKKAGFEKTAYQDLDDLMSFDRKSVNEEDSMYEKR